MPIYMNGDSCNVFSKLIVEGGVSGGGNVIPESTPISTIEVVNKTGTTINEGDKVWLNENIQTAGTTFTMNAGDSTAVSSYGTFIDREGLVGWIYNRFYSLNNDTATQIGTTSGFKATTSASATTVRYGPESSIFVSSGRCDSRATYAVGNYYVGGTYRAYSASGRLFAVAKFNLQTGEVTNNYVSSHSTNTYDPIYAIMVGDENPSFYVFPYYSSNKICKFTISGDETLTGTYCSTNTIDGGFYPKGVTSDNKYIFGLNSSGYLRIVEIISDINLKFLSREEMHEDLQPYYDLIPCCVVFNQYNGVLSITSTNTSTSSEYAYSYVVCKYENGVFTTLPIKFAQNYNFYSPLTFSDDMTRACFGVFNGDKGIIVNLDSTEGYSAFPYKLYNITVDTVTGKAMTSVEPNGSFQVATVL